MKLRLSKWMPTDDKVAPSSKTVTVNSQYQLEAILGGDYINQLCNILSVYEFSPDERLFRLSPDLSDSFTRIPDRYGYFRATVSVPDDTKYVEITSVGELPSERCPVEVMEFPQLTESSYRLTVPKVCLTEIQSDYCDYGLECWQCGSICVSPGEESPDQCLFQDPVTEETRRQILCSDCVEKNTLLELDSPRS